MFNVTVLALKYALLVSLYIFLIVALRVIYLDARGDRSSSAPRLVMLKGADARGTSYPLLGDELLIGRELERGLTIQDPFISTQHAKVVAQDGAYAIEDLGSKNGTYVNGRRISGVHPLSPGDRIKLGETILQFME